MIDYHIHTPLCHHAKGSMEAYVQSAIQKGLCEICFLDHLTLQESGQSLSMALSEVPLYFQAVQNLKYQYKGKIKIKAGLELDYHPDVISIFKEVADIYAFDMLGSSVHFLEGWNMVSRKSLKDYSEKKIEHIYGDYLKLLADMVEADYFDTVCHLDVAKKFGFKPQASFESDFEAILEIISKKDLAVEFNTSGYNHPAGEAYPSFELLLKCREKNIGLTIGSDAHKPEHIGRNYDKAFLMLKSAGYKHLITFTKRAKVKFSLTRQDKTNSSCQ